MGNTVLGMLAALALLVPAHADAAAPNGMPNATVEQLVTLAFSFSAGAHTESKTSVADCRKRDEGGWRCEATKISADRVKLVKVRLRDGYPIASEEPVPTLELAVDGICAYPYVVNGQRVPTGKPSQRLDRLGIALAGGGSVENFARLGYQARKAGWTPSGGWPS